MVGIVPTKNIFLACRVTDIRKRIDVLAVLVQEQLARDPHSGAVFVFRDKRGHLLKVLSYDGQGMYLFYERLDRGIFVWPWTEKETVTLSPAQLSMLLQSIDWRKSERTWRPSLAGRSRGAFS